jgi:hypothetical protein
VPAPPSSPIDPAIGHLAGLAEDAAEDPPRLLGVLARVADPRHPRGVRHRLVVILGLAVCAVLAGARSLTAIAERAEHERPFRQRAPDQAGRPRRRPRRRRRRTRPPRRRGAVRPKRLKWVIVVPATASQAAAKAMRKIIAAVIFAPHVPGGPAAFTR